MGVWCLIFGLWCDLFLTGFDGVISPPGPLVWLRPCFLTFGVDGGQTHLAFDGGQTHMAFDSWFSSTLYPYYTYCFFVWAERIKSGNSSPLCFPSLFQLHIDSFNLTLLPGRPFGSPGWLLRCCFMITGPKLLIALFAFFPFCRCNGGHLATRFFLLLWLNPHFFLLLGPD